MSEEHKSASKGTQQSSPNGAGNPASAKFNTSCQNCNANRRLIDEINNRLMRLELQMHELLVYYNPATTSGGLTGLLSRRGGRKGAGLERLSFAESPQKRSRSQPDNSGPRRTDLDPYLLPFLVRSPYLTPEQMAFVMPEMQRAFPLAKKERLESLTREWFRKRREYMTHRINAYCDRMYCMQVEADVLPYLQSDELQLDEIAWKCKLDVTECQEEARAYVLERVTSYFHNRRKTDPSID
jgi:hypothetical protein